MKKQRNTQQIKEQDECPPNQIKEEEIGNLPDKSQVALVVKNLPASAGDLGDVGLIRGSGRSSGGGNGNPLQYSCLENSMDRGAWRAAVHGVKKNQAQPSTHTHNTRRKMSGTHPLSC